MQTLADLLDLRPCELGYSVDFTIKSGLADSDKIAKLLHADMVFIHMVL